MRRRAVRRNRFQQALRRSRGRQLLHWLRERWLSLSNAVALFVLALAMLTTTQCRVEQIAVRRHSASSAEAVTRVTQLSQVIGHNIFLLNTERVAQELATIPSVLTVQVVPRLPNTVEIDIVERVPIATWRTPAGAFLVDEQGFALAPAETAGQAPSQAPDPPRPGPLLEVTDTTGQELRLGDQVDQRALLAARELVRALPGAGAQVQAVEYSPQGLVLVTDGGWRVVIGEARDLNHKLAGFAAVVDLARQHNLAIKLVDVRPRDRPVYQLAG
ncbi:MAG TPA: FtsQ-type POTRA domain-containing protein [Chloroflexota bacterium]|nr:FtsQ-type POTRA domain-containing protein [Chloroflexota bacterium]